MLICLVGDITPASSPAGYSGDSAPPFRPGNHLVSSPDWIRGEVSLNGLIRFLWPFDLRLFQVG